MILELMLDHASNSLPLLELAKKHGEGKGLHSVIYLLPGSSSGTPAALLGLGIRPVVEKKVVGDTGFEPVTSTV